MTEENLLSSVNGSLRDLGGGKGGVRMEATLPNAIDDDLWLRRSPTRSVWPDGSQRSTKRALHGTFAASFTSGWTCDGRVEGSSGPALALAEA